MKSSTVPRRLHHLQASVRELVRHTADSLGISLEIWDGPGRAPERFGLSIGCRTCEQEQPRVFDRCRKRRTYLSRREANLGLELAERCPLRLRLARLAPAGDTPGPTLFGFGYSANGGEVQQDLRVLSFLRDLRHMLDEATAMQTEVSRLADDLVAQSEEMDLLCSVAGRLGRAEDLHRIVVHVLSEWRQVIDGQCAILWLRDHVRLEFAFAPQQQTTIDARTHAVWEHFARRLVETLEQSGHDSHVERLGAQHPISRALGEDCECIAVPILVDRSVRGILCGLRGGGREDFGVDEVRLLRSLAVQLGMAITNTELYADLKSFLTNTVRTLVSAIDAKDPYTAGHSARVNIVSMLIGNEMGLDLEDLEALYWGSLLHDVGKIASPDSILNKPGKLAPEEIRVVMEHPQRGWELLHAIPQLERATDGVRSHHEWWNGNGYPQALAGESIPLIARIISVADAFDALIADRSYRRARSVAHALAAIDESTGTQFDPTVVKALHQLQPLLDKHQWVLMSGHKGPPGRP